MNRKTIALWVVLPLISTAALAQGVTMIREALSGYEEVPAVSTPGNGEFAARISRDESEIDWELSYGSLQGNVLQSHIHVGQAGVNGAISVFLCTNLGNGPAGTQPCPAPPAVISGTIRAADVTNTAAAQGVSAGELGELIEAMRAGVTYVNVHSSTQPGGEIRTQIDNGTP